jgi:hypothetical protein
MTNDRPKDPAPSTDQDFTRRDATLEVGSEGGSPGDVETGARRRPASGSEAGEVWQPVDEQVTEIDRDETGPGRRSP